MGASRSVHHTVELSKASRKKGALNIQRINDLIIKLIDSVHVPVVLNICVPQEIINTILPYLKRCVLSYILNTSKSPRILTEDVHVTILQDYV